MPRKKIGDPYLLRLKSMPRAFRFFYARPRLFISLGIGAASLLMMPSSWRLASRLLISWDIFIALYVTLAFVTVMTCKTSEIKRQATIQDDGRFLILALTALR